MNHKLHRGCGAALAALLLVAGPGAMAAPAPEKTPVVAGEMGTLQGFLSGELVPLDLKFSQMKEGWSRLHIERTGQPIEKLGAEEFASSDPAEQAFHKYFGKDSDAVWTQGRTLTLNGEPQLVVYRAVFPQSNQIERWFESRITDEMKAVENDNEKFMTLVMPVAREFLDTVPLRASLVNVGNIASLRDVEPFDFDRAFAAFEQEVRDPNSPTNRDRYENRARSARSDMGQWNLGLRQYLSAHNDTLPPLSDGDAARQALTPYVGTSFNFSATDQELHTNPLLSGKPLAHLSPYQDSLIVFYTSPDSQNNRLALFLSGEVRGVSPGEWPQLKKTSRLP